MIANSAASVFHGRVRDLSRTKDQICQQLWHMSRDCCGLDNVSHRSAPDCRGRNAEFSACISSELALSPESEAFVRDPFSTWAITPVHCFPPLWSQVSLEKQFCMWVLFVFYTFNSRLAFFKLAPLLISEFLCKWLVVESAEPNSCVLKIVFQTVVVTRLRFLLRKQAGDARNGYENTLFFDFGRDSFNLIWSYCVLCLRS